MRISDKEIENIRELAGLHFGKDVQVFLFGSRTMEQQRGGDIDLYIRNPMGIKLSIRSKINFIGDLIIRIGEQRIDVVLDNKEAENSVFFKTILKTAIQIC
jgi:uncharacterized protein